MASGEFDLLSKMLVQQGYWVCGEIKVAHFADISSLNIAKNDRCIVVSHHTKEFIAPIIASEIEH